jgi:hypothetical protein
MSHIKSVFLLLLIVWSGYGEGLDIYPVDTSKEGGRMFYGIGGLSGGGVCFYKFYENYSEIYLKIDKVNERERLMKKKLFIFLFYIFRV